MAKAKRVVKEKLAKRVVKKPIKKLVKKPMKKEIEKLEISKKNTKLVVDKYTEIDRVNDNLGTHLNDLIYDGKPDSVKLSNIEINNLIKNCKELKKIIKETKFKEIYKKL